MKNTLSFCLVIVAIASLSATSAIGQTTADRSIKDKLIRLSSPRGTHSTDCGTSDLNKPDPAVSSCATAAWRKHRPFRLLYSGPDFEFYHFAYGLASDGSGDIFEVEYDSRGLLNLGSRKRSQLFDNNRMRVTPCIKPVRLGNSESGTLGCVMPVNQEESQRAAQQEPIEATVCAILERPSTFNNKIVRIHGYASGNFEYSNLGADGCSDELWFMYGNGEGPPNLMATVNGGARIGAEDSYGRLILPVPVTLVEDSHFRKFQELMSLRAKADEKSLKEDGSTFTLHRVAATFVGRIDGVSDDIHAFHLRRRETDRVDFLGFGQMGLFDAQFVLKSVEGDPRLESFPPVVNPLSQNEKK